MTGVRISLSNGMQSPIFSRGDKWRSKHSVLNVNGEVRRILLKCDNPTTGIEFIDSNKKQICKWEGNIEDRGAWRCQEVPDGEQVVGIYGHSTGYNHILNFGFITASYS